MGKFKTLINESDVSVKGMSVDVFRSHLGDSTNKGLSSKKNTLILVSGDFKVEGPFEVKSGEDYLVLVKGPLNTIRAVPKSLLDNNSWVMFGGNFCFTSDSRFSKLNDGNPIKIFDRVE